MFSGTVVLEYHGISESIWIESWLCKGEEGFFISIATYDMDNQSDIRKEWLLNAKDVEKWTDENIKLFRIICDGGLHINISKDLHDLEANNDEAYIAQRECFVDEFIKAANKKGLRLAGIGFTYFTIKCQACDDDINKPVVHPSLWNKIRGSLWPEEV